MKRRGVILGVLVLAACGGEVVVFSSGTSTGSGSTTSSGSGSSGSGTGSSSGSGGGAMTSSGSAVGSTGSGTVDPVEARCSAICENANASGCWQADCASTCSSLTFDDGPCSVVVDELLTCWATQLAPGMCSPPAACEATQLAYLACSGDTLPYNGCPDASYEGQLPLGGCSSMACDTEGHVYTESCFCEDEGELSECQCECVRDGQVVGYCEEYGDEGCYPLAACCEFVFF